MIGDRIVAGVKILSGNTYLQFLLNGASGISPNASAAGSCWR